MDENSEQNASIERCPHDKENPYVMVNRDLIRDESLHPTTRLILIQLLSNKSGWKIQIKQFIKLLKPHGYGKDKVYYFFKQACEVGYMKKEEILVSGLKRVRYLLSETPKFKKCLPRSSQQDAADQDPAEPHLKKEHKFKKEHSKDSLSKDKEREAPPPKPLRASIKREEHVFTSEDEHQKLVEKLGLEETNFCYKHLSEWKLDKPKKSWRKSDYLSILRWVIDARNDIKNKLKFKKTSSSSSKIDKPMYAKSRRVNGKTVYFDEFGNIVDINGNLITKKEI